MSKISAPRGTVDILPAESWKWQAVERIAREVAALYHFAEIRTPIFEHTELFHRGVGETTDIVDKETYTFEDRGGRSITLRPEGTAGVVRAVIEERLLNRPGRRASRSSTSARTSATSARSRAVSPAPPVRRRSVRRRRAGAGCRVHPAADGFLSPLRREGPGAADQQPRRPRKQAALSRCAGRISHAQSRRSSAKIRSAGSTENPLRILDSKDPRDAGSLPRCAAGRESPLG